MNKVVSISRSALKTRDSLTLRITMLVIDVYDYAYKVKPSFQFAFQTRELFWGFRLTGSETFINDFFFLLKEPVKNELPELK